MIELAPDLAPSSPVDALTLAHGPDWQNRLTVAPLTNKQSHADGTVSDQEHDWLTSRGRGGFGMTMTCAAFVSQSGQGWRGQLGVSHERHAAGLTRLAASLRAAGTRSSVQLNHNGRRSDPALTGLPIECPWEVPGSSTPAMSLDAIEQAVEDFAAAAARAERAGFDGVEVHGAHGYLVGQFLDARYNHRVDGYGGSLAGRAAFLFAVLRHIRAVTGADFQLGLRLTPEGYGISIEEGRELARWVLESGLVDYLDMSVWDVYSHPRAGSDRLMIDHFVDLPRHGTRLGVTGKVLSFADAAWCLAKGADFVGIGTGAILHHDWATRALNDPAFTSDELPVTAESLRREHVGQDFIDYLSADWDNFVA